MCAGPTLWLFFFIIFIKYKNRQLLASLNMVLLLKKIESHANEQLLCKIHNVS